MVGWSPRIRNLLLLATVFGIAALLRMFRLGMWALEGDEINTLRDSLSTTVLHGSKPLLFFLNHHLIGTWTRFDETTMRVLPALFGLAGVVAIYGVARALLSPRAGLLCALIVSFSAWHVYWSQYARYYSLVFLLSAIFPFVLYLGMRDRQPARIVVGVLVTILAILAHPSAGLLLGAFLVWVVVSMLADDAGRKWLRTRGGIAALGTLIATMVVLATWKFLPLLRHWTVLQQDWGHRGPSLLLSYIGNLGLVVPVFAAGGLLWMWHAGQRLLAALLFLLVAAPIAILFAMSYLVPVSTAYLFATAPAVFLLTGYFLDRCSDIGPKPRGLRLLAVVCTSALLLGEGPVLLSHFRDGSRLDFRGAARFLQEESRADDLIIADQARLLRYYLPNRSVVQFRRDSAYGTSLSAADEGLGALTGSTWLVVAHVRRGGFNEWDLGAATTRVQSTCRLSSVFGRPRLDYRHNELRVYSCAAERASTAIADRQLR